MLGGLLLGLLLFGHSHQECHCKKCIKERKEDAIWWKNYYKKHPPGLSVSTSLSGSTSPSGSTGLST